MSEGSLNFGLVAVFSQQTRSEMLARPPDGSDGTPPAVEALRTLRILLQELEHPAPLDATTTRYACDGTRHIKGVAPTLHDGRATWISERV